jgi:triacylglycerol lipase
MKHLIVLAHGVCRFDVFWQNVLPLDNNDDPEIDKFHYFKGVRTLLKKHEFEVWHTSVPWAASVEKRAAALRKNILAILEGKAKSVKVHIIAHSMGGLDTRHMLFQDRNDGLVYPRIASLTTISTPHAGSPFADWTLDHMSEALHVAKAIGLDLRAVQDLTTTSCCAFNRDPEVLSFEDKLARSIRFRTYGGHQSWYGTFWPLKIPHKIIEDQEGRNDGLVSVASAKWREDFFQEEIPKTDHLNELGWWDPSQIGEKESPASLLRRTHDLYLEIAREITAGG